MSAAPRKGVGDSGNRTMWNVCEKDRFPSGYPATLLFVVTEEGILNHFT
jgi:hypothetical protein